jgi:hypothetical protein
MPPLKTTLHLELTAAQKAQIRAATGRNVNVLELRLQDWLEPGDGQEGAAEPESPVGRFEELPPAPPVIRSASDESGR